jgi:hypothetical protein
LPVIVTSSTRSGAGPSGSRAPTHPIGSGLGPCDLERRLRRVHGGHGEAATGEQAGQGPGAAADIKHAARAELVDHGRVCVQVTAVGVQRVVDLGKTLLGEDRINHTPHGRQIRNAKRASI